MITKNFFRGLVVIDFLTWPALMVLYFFTDYLSNIDYLYDLTPTSFIDTDIGLILSVCVLVSYFFSYILLLSFIKIGRYIYLITLLSSIILEYSSGIYIAYGFPFLIEIIAGFTTGMILLLIFTSPIKDEF